MAQEQHGPPAESASKAPAPLVTKREPRRSSPAPSPEASEPPVTERVLQRAPTAPKPAPKAPPKDVPAPARAEPKAPPTVEPRQADLPSLEFEIKHAETGYKNAQDIIKFMDTKSGVIAGFAFVGIGFVLQVTKEFLSSPTDLRSAVVDQFKSAWAWEYTIFALTVLSLIMGISCVYCVVQCITARPPHIPSNLKHTILFPHCGTSDANYAREYYAKLKSGLTAAEVAAEYEHQLLNVGSILCQKITWHRRAANAFLLQLASLTLAGALFLMCVWFVKAKSQPPAPASTANVPSVTSSNTPSLPPPVHAPSNPIPSSTP
jgi:hypothetical protein